MVDEYARSFASMRSELQVERMRTIQVEWTNPFSFLITWYDSAYHIHRMLCDLTIKVVNNKKTRREDCHERAVAFKNMSHAWG